MAHKVELPEWAIARGRQLNHFSALEPTRTAHVVIDMQNVFTEADEVFGNPYALGIVEAVNTAVVSLRAAGALIVWTRQTVASEPPLAMPEWQYDLSIPAVREAVETMAAGTRSHALHGGMAVQGGDVVVDKYRYGAFSCPAGALQRVLQSHGIDTLVVAGTLTNCCCDSTAREANMLGYRVIFLSDATATRTDEEHNAALLCVRLCFADVRTVPELLGLVPSGFKEGEGSPSVSLSNGA